MYRYNIYFKSLLVILFLNLLSCSDNSDSNNPNTLIQQPTYATATINWIANRELAVNSPKGGYRVYYSNRSPVTTADNFTDVAFDPASGTTPTIASIRFDQKGQYYIAVQAYSGLNSNSVSDLSAEFNLIVQ